MVVDYVGEDGCAQTKHLDITDVPAQRPLAFTDVTDDGRTDSGRTAEIGITSGDTDAECAVMSADPIGLTITSGGVREKAEISDPCSGWSTARHRRRHRTFVINYSNVTADHASLAWLELRGHQDRRRVRFGYSLTWHGRTLLRGRIVGVTHYQAPHQIWSGTDAYINYCINNNKQTYSENGNLYCWYDGYLRRSWKITRSR